MDPACPVGFRLVGLTVYALCHVDNQVRIGCVCPEPPELLADKVLGNKSANLL
jgi:hypothetical protein